MRCPIDGNELRMTERGGVEIDYCPQCRGVWLDRGELDKIIDRASEIPQAASNSSETYPNVPQQSQPAGAVWDDDPRPQHNAPPQSYPQQQYPPQTNSQQPPQNAGKNLTDQIVPALGGLIAGMAASKMGGNKGYGGGYHPHKKRKKSKGWMDDMFDFD